MYMGGVSSFVIIMHGTRGMTHLPKWHEILKSSNLDQHFLEILDSKDFCKDFQRFLQRLLKFLDFEDFQKISAPSKHSHVQLEIQSSNLRF